jgi:cleavage and polyadenylation specificity factor subunit 3
MIKFASLCGSEEVNTSCFYLNIDGTGIVLDCGMHPRKIGVEALPKIELLEDCDVDFGIISHAHQDHIGSLPYLVQRHPYVQLFSTPQTRAIAELTLHNSVNIMEKSLTPEDPIRPYSHEEIDFLIQSMNYKEYNNQFSLKGYRHKSDESINITFYDAGHILGSAAILIEYNDRKIFYTGDINLESQSIIPGAELPHDKIDVLIIETTYGATDSSLIPSWNEEARRLALSANKILEQDGSVLIPVFSLGKMQEMLSTISNLMEKGFLTKTDIYTGGIGKKINKVYDYNRYVTRRNNQNFQLTEIPQKDIYEVKHYDEFKGNPSIVLAPSGMVLEGTLSFKLVQEWIKQKKYAIFFVGYMDPTTPGYKVMTSHKGLHIQFDEFTRPLTINCEIEHFKFSAHARREGLLKIVEKLKPQKVVLVHGDPDAVSWMDNTIRSKFQNVNIIPSGSGHLIEL